MDLFYRSLKPLKQNHFSVCYTDQPPHPLFPQSGELTGAVLLQGSWENHLLFQHMYLLSLRRSERPGSLMWYNPVQTPDRSAQLFLFESNRFCVVRLTYRPRSTLLTVSAGSGLYHNERMCLRRAFVRPPTRFAQMNEFSRGLKYPTVYYVTASSFNLTVLQWTCL